MKEKLDLSYAKIKATLHQMVKAKAKALGGLPRYFKSATQFNNANLYTRTTGSNKIAGFVLKNRRLYSVMMDGSVIIDPYLGESDPFWYEKNDDFQKSWAESKSLAKYVENFDKHDGLAKLATLEERKEANEVAEKFTDWNMVFSKKQEELEEMKEIAKMTILWQDAEKESQERMAKVNARLKSARSLSKNERLFQAAQKRFQKESVYEQNTYMRGLKDRIFRDMYLQQHGKDDFTYLTIKPLKFSKYAKDNINFQAKLYSKTHKREIRQICGRIQSNSIWDPKKMPKDPLGIDANTAYLKKWLKKNLSPAGIKSMPSRIQHKIDPKTYIKHWIDEGISKPLQRKLRAKLKRHFGKLVDDIENAYNEAMDITATAREYLHLLDNPVRLFVKVVDDYGKKYGIELNTLVRFALEIFM